MKQTSERIRTCYDTVAREYAARFADELTHKPLDRELLIRFASEVRDRGLVYDLGCGPGQTTALLHAHGVQVRGLDLSPAILREANRLHPGIEFEWGDLLELACPDESLIGVVGFYAIVHFSPDDLQRAIEQVKRVLRPGGWLLLAFHIGEGSIHIEEFLGRTVTIDFVFFHPDVVVKALTQLGFVIVEVIEREPYPDVEYPSRRAYIFARKPES